MGGGMGVISVRVWVSSVYLVWSFPWRDWIYQSWGSRPCVSNRRPRTWRTEAETNERSLDCSSRLPFKHTYAQQY